MDLLLLDADQVESTQEQSHVEEAGLGGPMNLYEQQQQSPRGRDRGSQGRGGAGQVLE